MPLIFIGTLGAFYYMFSSNDENVDVQQYTYQSLADCQADWGTDAGNCQSEPASSGYGSTHGFYGSSYGSNTAQRYTGPRFFWQRTASGGHPVEVLPDGSTRPISGARLSSGSGSTRAISTHVTSGSISRGGFGSSAGRFSSGG